jgi:hypothetical protein
MRSGEYRALRQPLIANDLNAVTGISLRNHSFIVYNVDIYGRVPNRPGVSGVFRSAIVASSLL